MNKTNMQELTHLRTSWGSLIAPYIQQRIIKRIKANDSMQEIIDEELDGILDSNSDQYDEAHEIYSYCETMSREVLNGSNN
jgi:hypothetical protein